MLVVITTSQKLDCLRKLGSVFCNHQNLPMEFVQSIAEALKLINTGGVKAVFSLGSGPLEEVQAAGYVPKNRKVTGLRKQVMSLAGIPLLVSYSPNIGEIDYSQFVDLLTDTNLACVLASTGSISPKYGEYQYVPTLAPIVQGIKALLEDPSVKKVPLAFDTETLGLDRFHPEGYLISLQFSFKVGTAYMVAWSSRAESLSWLQDFQNQQDLHWLMNEPRIAVRAANGKYDLEWLYEHSGVTCTNFTADTTLIGSLLDENRSNGLDVHAKIYAPRLAGYSDDFDQKTDKSRMDLAYARDPKKFLNYSAGDADATLEVSINQIAQLTAVPHLARFYVNILHPAARAFELVERGGVCIDMEEFNRLEADLIADLHSLTDKAKKIIGGSLVAKHFDQDKTGGLNLTKASLITDFMFSPRGLNLKPKMLTEKTKAPVTSLEHLEMFKDVPEAQAFVSLMSEFSSTNKTLSTYIVGFRSYIRSDGRFHPSYWLHAGNKDAGEGGTNTGRVSARDPAFQCLKGSTLVLLEDGQVPIVDVVNRYERGERFKVLTHTGKWRDVVGVYRNGVQPVFEVKASNGFSVTCTANHPLLTDRGWVRTDQLKEGDTCYAYKGDGVGAQNPRIHQPNVSQLGSHEEPLHQPHLQELGGLRGPGNHFVPSLDGVQNLPSRHGGEAGPGVVDRTPGQQRQLRAGELFLGNPKDSGKQSTQCPSDNLPEQNTESVRLGQGVRDDPRMPSCENAGRYDDGSSTDEACPVERQVFEEVIIVSITPRGGAETFDITVDKSHSFVANGLAVHNTIPKHTKWGKRIRRCYNAPPGMLVAEEDYSQGELKVMACLANEQVMIEAYLRGLDLHVVTSSFVAGLTYDEMMALKKTDKDQYDDIRQLGKAGNFGLIYGMGVDGFIDYARTSYGVIMSYEKAAEFHAGFFTRYPGLPNYHRQYKEFAHRHGHVVSPLGRVRHLPLINAKRSDIRSKDERRAVNAPVQSTLSDMMLWAIAIQHEMGWFDESPCFGAIHDASYLYVPEDNYEFYARRSTEVMENLPFHRIGWEPQLKFTADAKVGPNMGQLTELKFT